MTTETGKAPVKPVIMIVDDKEILRSTMRLMLEDLTSRFRFIDAESGERAIELVREQLPKLILMDISMPGIGGLEATRRIKEEWGDIIIIGLSMHVLEDIERAMKDAGTDGNNFIGDRSEPGGKDDPESIRLEQSLNSGENFGSEAGNIVVEIGCCSLSWQKVS